MRAGSLDRVITIQAYGAGGTDDYGTPTVDWAPVATVRAQLIESTTEEYQRAYGEGGETAMIFRTRFVPDITTDHRILYGGRQLNIKQVKEIGRRRGLELRTEAREA